MTPELIQKRVLTIGVALLFAGCGLGSVHPGEKARADKLAMGCVTEADAKRFMAFLDAKESTENINIEFMYSGRCIKILDDETLTVIAEDGDFRKIRRPDGKEYWVPWQYLNFVDFK